MLPPTGVAGLAYWRYAKVAVLLVDNEKMEMALYEPDRYKKYTVSCDCNFVDSAGNFKVSA